MQLTDIYRYPVKSMGGQRLSQAQLGTQGVPGDRVWAIRDNLRNNFKTGKRFGALMGCSATLQAEPSTNTPSPRVRIQLTNGVLVNSSDPNANQQLSDFLENDATLWPLQPATELDHYRRQPPTADDELADPRAVFARTADEPLPDLSQFPKELFEYESPPGTYFDAFPLMIMSQASLTALAAKQPNSEFAVARFRPNLLVDGPSSEDFPEDAWVGKKLRLGGATLAVEFRCPRCVMTTHGFADLPKDPSIMRALVQQHGGDLGVYANVVKAGLVKTGDTIELAS